ncbi:hypothetical protein DICVIV_09614 [Dictyocaulus viviparus]|uniref:Uncharacterized protein n=1 Tax=Dictyocaulus viviparus TaxID=29172 RepID=A0A0D8XI62_DICVI|nr:hypothetical protein DICVIV_09614 [Dictyocaulus viviparus]
MTAANDVNEKQFLRYYNKPSQSDAGVMLVNSLPAKRAGDYYMFDYDPNTDELIKPVESFVPEVTPDATRFEKLDPGQASVDTAVEFTAAPNSESFGAKVTSLLKFLLKITVNAIEMVSVFLNRLSREHRYVAYVLSKEKEKLKEGHSQELSDTSQRLTDLRENMDMTELLLVQNEGDIQKMEYAALSDWQQRSVMARLMKALGSCVAANTDLISYFLAVMAHASGAGVITLPLPLMVFFWGTLSNPRPSKFFWVAMIAYTEFVVAFSFFLSHRKFLESIFAIPIKVLGVQRQSNFAAYDVSLLFALFFHRYMLRKLGLWKDANLTVTFQNLQPQNEGNISTQNTCETQQESKTQPSVMEGDPSGTAVRPSGSLVVSPAVPPQISTSMAVERLSSESRAGAGSDAKIQSSKLVLHEAVKTNPEVRRNPLNRFITQLFKPKFRYIRDLYPIMFGLDVVAFLIVAFGYSAFGEGGSGNVIGDIQSNRIPLTFVVMVIVMTLMIIIDRGLYLRKWVYGKLAYQLVMILFLHIWLFFILPHITRSCKIIVRGEMHVPAGVGMANSQWISAIVYWEFVNTCIWFMLVPFLFELRTVIDWTWTDTSMPLFDFFNMENFYTVIYNLKCARTFEKNYPSPQGVPKGVIVKYLMGLPMILLIVFLVWCPLLAFSLMNKIGDISIPNSVRLSISLEGYPALYEIEAQGTELHSMSSEDLRYITDAMSRRYFPSTNGTDSIKRSRDSVSFLREYTSNDILVVDFRPESSIPWAISEASLNALIEQLKGNSSIKFIVAMEFTRPYDSKKNQETRHSAQWSMDLQNKTSLRDQWIRVLQNPGVNETIFLPETFPSYVLVPNEGVVMVPTPIVSTIQYNQDNYQRPENASECDWFDALQMSLVKSSVGNVWVVQAKHPPQYTNVYFNSSNITYGIHRDRSYVQTVAFVDKAFPSFFAKYLQGGVIAMYVSVTIVVSRIVRSMFSTPPTSVMVSEIPNPDFLLKICLDIYLVREAKDFFLEQDLFAKLIFLFRSPSTLIEWTRQKPKRD